ncbi:MAG: adenylate kinase [Pseudonocardiaceae bacterium]
MRLVLLGPHGAGKGTQAVRIAERYMMPHVSTGDILRENAEGETELGLGARQYMDRGELVPDDVMNGMVADRLAQPDTKARWLLDGYPRTVPQAEVFEQLLDEWGTPLDAVLCLKVPEEELDRRIHARAQFQGRSDDTGVAVRRRLEEYVEKTAPLEAFYRQRRLLWIVDGVGPIDEVTDRTFAALEQISS